MARQWLLLTVCLACLTQAYSWDAPPHMAKTRRQHCYKHELRKQRPRQQSLGLEAVATPLETEAGSTPADTLPGATAKYLSLLKSKQAGEEDAAQRTKSVLVLSWFFANPRELKLVERVYRRFGYADVLIYESPVAALSKPRGWYRTFIGSLRDDGSGGGGGGSAALARSFDLVHCMSGGFLQLYLLLAAGVALDFKTLVFDSTPIMPRPASFVRFTRAYLEDNGGRAFNRLVPLRAHNGAIRAKWSVGCMYVRLKHRLRVRRRLQQVGEAARARGDNWENTIARAAMKGDYARVVDHALSTIFNRPHPISCVFVYNPNDKYIDQADIGTAVARAAAAGNAVVQVEVDTPHIQTIFRKPAALFNALNDAEGGDGA